MKNLNTKLTSMDNMEMKNLNTKLPSMDNFYG